MTIPLEVPEITEIKEMLERALRGQSAPEWYTLEQAYAVKYGSPELGPSILTIKKNTALQPAAGRPDGWQHSKKAWKRETVERWARVSDETLGQYLSEVAPGERVPEFIAAALQKRSRIDRRLLAEAAV
ncbi:hypothetical protein K7J14_08465 [Treponema zuelzerae]|uniref:Uncharacterized protein n=1 Tax=Teretinema zuelzerae TaxID=156 RepID=A0AAE3EJ52_9SPIR|nr:hypothetical protein [Teretinema zuelzerae]MCD1654738.1 hypothetical protein [Teretinema zuelzerae]